MTTREKKGERSERKSRKPITVRRIDLKDVKLNEFKEIVAGLTGAVVWDNVSIFLENVYEHNEKGSIEYLQSIFDESFFVKEKRKLSELLLGFIRDEQIDLFKFHVDIYSPDLMKYVIKKCYSGNKHPYKLEYNIFGECSEDLLKFIFTEMNEVDNLESFWKFYGSETTYPELNVVYDKLIRRGNSELLIFIDDIIEDGMDGNFYTDYVCNDNLYKNLQRYLKVSLEEDDL